MNNPPVPGVATKPDREPVLTTCQITWPDGSQVRAEMESFWSEQKAAVKWSGAIERLTESPPSQLDACTLAVWLEHQAGLIGSAGEFKGWHEGVWPAMDEVVG